MCQQSEDSAPAIVSDTDRTLAGRGCGEAGLAHPRLDARGSPALSRAMSARLKSEIWAAAWLRRCAVEGAPAVLRRRGAASAGAIFLKVDRLDGNAILYGPAPQSAYDDNAIDRRFLRLHDAGTIETAAAEERMKKEIRFDPDLWLLEVEDRAGRSFLADDEIQKPEKLNE